MVKMLLITRGQFDIDLELGKFEFASVPRQGELILHNPHHEQDRDDTEPEPRDVSPDGTIRRWYRVEAVVHFTKPLEIEDQDFQIDGYLVVSNAGPTRKVWRRSRDYWKFVEDEEERLHAKRPKL